MALPDSQPNRWRTCISVVLAFAAGIGILAAVWLQVVRRGFRQRSDKYPTAVRSLDLLLVDARQQLEQGHPEKAESLARHALDLRPDSLEARVLAAQAALRSGRPAEAASYLTGLARLVPAEKHVGATAPDGKTRTGSPPVVTVTSGQADEATSNLFAQAGDVLWQVGRAREAEACLRRALASWPDQVLALRRLAFLLTVQGRRWESQPMLFTLLKNDAITLDELVLLGDLWPDYNLPSETRRYLNAVPDDPLPRLALARDALHRFQYEQARQWLEEILFADSKIVEAHAWLGWVLAQNGSHVEFSQWASHLPVEADEHPQIWYVRGLYAQNAHQPQAAVRYFWEATRRDPNHDQAHYQLGVLLAAMDQPSLAEPFRSRAERLFALAAALKDVYNHREQLATRIDADQKLRRIIELCQQLGRLWEARQWCRVLLTMRPNSNWAQQTLLALNERITPDMPRTLPEICPGHTIDLSQYPLPDVIPRQPAERVENRSISTSTKVRFVDRAADAGLHFTAYNGDDPTIEEVRLLESTGGGVGVVDYDGDAWPDVYFTQACPWPPNERQTQYRDRLFRNMGDGTFRDITNQCGLGDTGFSQGVAVGDYNNDGFPDIFVANIGPNRLYVNNGDGTFSLAWEGPSALIWTASCALADLNGDTLPDIYEVNYLGGDVFDRRCAEGRRPRTCPPSLFPAVQDRLLLNLGDGRFEDVTEQTGIVAEGGKGLGIVIADFDHSGKLSIFVANDGTPNFFFANKAARGQLPSFDNRAFLTGLACDRFGQFQASMGVAAGDADQDGHMDLFVTNFYDESNTLYLNRHGGAVFQDEAMARGLGQPSLKMLGFGTQFVDGELDGWPDLVVTNGHIEDRSAWGQPFQMPCQYFRNRGGGLFEEVSPDELGEFFRRRLLGRGMARLDWNADGREDVVISCMNQPVVLLTNETRPAGNVLIIELRGTFSDRDAVGATVEVTAGGRIRTAQVTAGDGYMASNQKQLVFGLGAATSVERLVIRWPSGLVQQWIKVPNNARFCVVEGRNEWVRLPLIRQEGDP